MPTCSMTPMAAILSYRAPSGISRRSRCSTRQRPSRPSRLIRACAHSAWAREEGDPVRLNAVVLGRPDGEPSPSAADVEHGLAGLETELAAHEIDNIFGMRSG